MSYANAQAFLKNDANFPPDTSSCAYHLATHSMLVDIMMGLMNPFAVAYQNCVRDLQSHLLLGLRLHYGDEGRACHHMALWILYWLTQQFLYYLSHCKFGRDPPLPNFDRLMRHTHTKTLDGFVGKLPTSWMEKVKPPAAAASTQTKKGKDKDAEADIQVTNTNWNPSLKKCWEASGLTMLHDMLKKKPDNVDILKMGDKTACLSWIVKGHCFSTCPPKDLHKQANSALVDATHKLMDACSVPASN